MCDCATCGAYVPCGNPGCTNDECHECRELRESLAQADPPEEESDEVPW